MSSYWKQSLWLGGVYWIISLILSSVDTFETYFADFIFSLSLTIFLIPMNFLNPIKWIDKVIKKLPIFSTFLVFVGWAPYVSILVFLVTTIYGFSVILSGAMNIDGLVLTLITPLSVLTVVKLLVFYFLLLQLLFGYLLTKNRLPDVWMKNLSLLVEIHAICLL